MPEPALTLVTPVLINVKPGLTLTFELPEVVTCIPVPGVILTDVTVPDTVLLDMLVTLPYASTVTVGFVYCEATTPVAGKSKTMLPAPTIGLLLTVIVLDVTPTLVTVPEPPLLPVVEIVIFPVLADIVTPDPAVKLVTPIFVMSTAPDVALAFTPIPVLPVKLTYWLAVFASIAKLFFDLLNAK
jgi:hypothetical protein